MTNAQIADFCNHYFETDCWTAEQVGAWRHYFDLEFMPGVGYDNGHDYPIICGEEHSSFDFYWEMKNNS